MNKYDGKDRRNKNRRKTTGRRDEDKVTGVCIWHDVCHETVSDIKQSQIDHEKDYKEFVKVIETKFDKIDSTKLPVWIFRLFLSTAIPFLIAAAGWIGYNAFETTKILTRLDANQRHLMEEFSIPLAVKPEKENAEDKSITD